jgi:uncharacterized protein YrrD
MHKGSDVIGKPVITLDEGKKIHKIYDVLFDAEHKNILGFLLQEGGVFQKALVLPFAGVKKIGTDAFTIERENVVVEAEQDERIKAVIKSHNTIKGKKVMTESGEFLGSVSDIFFNETSGEIVGYEVSGGMFSDAYSGKSFLPAPKTLTIGADVVFVPDDVAQLMEEQVGGIKGSMQRAGGTVKDAAENLKDKMPETNQMKAKGKNVFQSTDKAFERGSENLKSQFGTVWENVKAKASSLKEQVASKTEEQRVKAALGKPVTRMILDDEDKVIIRTGDIITHQAIEQAREAGALDMLLSSVYKKDPAFSSDELKAKGGEYKSKEKEYEDTNNDSLI